MTLEIDNDNAIPVATAYTYDLQTITASENLLAGCGYRWNCD